MSCSPRFIVAVLGSLLLHAGIGVALAWLPCRNGEATPCESEPSCFMVCVADSAGEGADKLLEGQHAASSILDVSAQSGTEFSIPIPAAGHADLGPALDGNSQGTGPAIGQTGSGELSPGGHGGAPGGSSTSFFGVPTRGQRIVYVIDRSGSMGEKGRLDAAKRELLASLRQLPADAFFQVIAYNSIDEILVGHAEELVPATAAHIVGAVEAFQNLEAVGGTHHLPALTVALRMRPDVVFFLTDSDDLTEVELASTRRLNTSHAVFHTLELTLTHMGQTDMPMQVLARTTGGSYTAVDMSVRR